MSNDARLGLAQKAFESGDISKEELAGIMHQEGAISDQEYSGFAAPQSPGFDVPQPVQKTASFLGALDRAPSALGAAKEQLLLGKGNAAAVASFMKSMAGSPPAEGEKMGSFIGSLGSPSNLAGTMIPGGTAMKAIGSGAAMGGATNLLDQAEMGHIDPMKTLGSTALGGALGFLTNRASTAASDFLGKAPSIIEAIDKTPQNITKRFIGDKNIMQGAPTTAEGMTQNLESKAADIKQALQGVDMSSKANYQVAASRTGVNETPGQRASFKPLPSSEIETDIQRAESMLPKWKQDAEAKIASAQAMGLPPEQIAQVAGRASSDALKQLLYIRNSISERIGQPDEFGIVKGGLADLRPRVNALIESLPGGDIIRNADGYTSKVTDLHKQLVDSLATPNKTLDFVKNIFSSNSGESKDNMRLLVELEKMTGKPIIDPMLKAITQSSFAPALAGNTIKRSIMGITPFLMSGLLRSAGVPFQISLPLSAAIATAGQSPALGGTLIRGAQAAEPYMQAGAKATAVGGLAALRKMMEAK